MTLFDLLFILAVLAAVVSLMTASVQLVLRHRDRAKRTLRRIGVSAGLYLLVVTLVSIVLPRDILRIGRPQCFDDWCISADTVTLVSSPLNKSYRVGFRVSSKAGRVSQRERGVTVYLIDQDNNRYDPSLDPTIARFDTLLAPGDFVEIDRVFTIPLTAENVGLVITHEGGFPIQWFILGEGVFRKPPIIPLEETDRH